MTGKSAPSIFVGTHRRAHRGDAEDAAHGIYRFEVDGRHLAPAGMTPSCQPGWLALHPDRRFLYAVNEVREMDGRKGGAVSAFAIDQESGALTELNSRPMPPMPCHCSVDASGRYLLVATFGGGSVHLLGIDDDGGISGELDCHWHEGSSVHPVRQASAHAHAVAVHPGNRFVLVPDLGTDRLYLYEIDHEAGRLIAAGDMTVSLPAGSGPRHVAFSRDGTRAYLMNEMSASITSLSFNVDTGAMRILQSVDLLPVGFEGLRSGAAIAVHPVGNFLYATTRSHGSSGEPVIRGLDAVLWFGITDNGLLTFKGRVSSQGQIPRSFAFDHLGERLFVAHQCSGTIVTFEIAEDGAPVFKGEIATTPVPVCLQLVDV